MASIEFIKQHHQLISVYGGYAPIADVARTCYKSHPNTLGANERLVRMLIKNEHEAMIEFGEATVRFVTDRAITHELVRHRMGSYAQESQRYVNYEKQDRFRFIEPLGIDIPEHRDQVRLLCQDAADCYESLVKEGVKPQVARCVLPNCIATTIVCKYNFREWRHVFKLRCSQDAHPQMRELMLPLLDEMKHRVPIIFDDLSFD